MLATESATRHEVLRRTLELVPITQLPMKRGITALSSRYALSEQVRLRSYLKQASIALVPKP
jgi:hypothetical protein